MARNLSPDQVYFFHGDRLRFIRSFRDSMGTVHRFAYSNGAVVDIGPDEISLVTRLGDIVMERA